MTRGQRGWLAGILDGEGSITACVQYGPHSWMFKPRIFVANTHSRGIHSVKDLLEEIVKHPLSLDARNREGNRKRQYSVQVSAHPDIPIVLKTLLPDLVIKKDQAILTLTHMEWRLKQTKDTGRGGRYPKEVYEKDCQFLDSLHTLNGRLRTRTDYTEILREYESRRKI